MHHRYTPESLLPAYRQLFSLLQAQIDPAIACQLKARRVVSRHGTCSSVLVWTLWDRRQIQAILPPGFFAYGINYDPDHFETDRTDWSLKLHMNTVRIYHNALDVRQYLLNQIPSRVPQGFRWTVHPRQLVVEYPFDFSGSPSDLPALLVKPLHRLVTTTHPVIDKLLKAFTTNLAPIQRAAFIAGRTIPHAPAALGALVPFKGSYSHSVPAPLRAEVLRRHGNRCALCGLPIPKAAVAHIDHIKPFSRGGLTTIDNLQPTHPACNLAKGAAKTLPPEHRSPAKRRIRIVPDSPTPASESKSPK